MSAQRTFLRRSAAAAAGLVLPVAANSPAVELLNELVPATVEVPSAQRVFLFDHDRVLMIPSGFKISIIARIIAARFIMPLSTGEILVAETSRRSSGLEGRQRTTATKSILPLLHSCPGGVRKSAIHSP